MAVAGYPGIVGMTGITICFSVAAANGRVFFGTQAGFADLALIYTCGIAPRGATSGEREGGGKEGSAEKNGFHTGLCKRFAG